MRLKRRSPKLAEALEALGYVRAARSVAFCQQRIDSDIHDVDGIAEEVMTGRYSCKHVFCPPCQSARARRNIAVLAPIICQVQKDHPGVHFQVWTLTYGATAPTDTAAALTIISTGWTQLMRNSAYRAAVLGAVRCLEVTRNAKTSWLHGHCHNLVALHPRYYEPASNRYISADKLRDDWSRKMGRTVSQIDMKQVLPRDNGENAVLHAVVECVKYAVKPSDIFYGDDETGWHCDLNAVRDLLPVLKGRRKISLSGVFYQARQKLKLPAPDSDEGPDFYDIHDPQLAPYVASLVRVWDSARYEYAER